MELRLLKRVLILFFIGFFLGPIGDYFHVLSQTTGYPQGVFDFYWGPIPFWVPFLFGSASIGVGLSHPWFDGFLGGPPVRPGARNAVIAWIGIFSFLGLYCLSGFLPGGAGGLSDGILALLAILIWALLDWTWQGILLGVLTAITGTALEITLVHLEIFSYLPPKNNLLGVASWLPWLYFAASVTLGNFGRYLKRS